MWPTISWFISPEHHFDDVQRLLVGDAHPVAKGARQTHGLEDRGDLAPATMHDDGIDFNQLQQCDVAAESGLHGVVGPRHPTVVNDERFPMEAAQVRQRFRQDLRFLAKREHSSLNSDKVAGEAAETLLSHGDALP